VQLNLKEKMKIYLKKKKLKISSVVKTGVLSVKTSFSFIANIMSIVNRTPVCSLIAKEIK